MKILELPDLCHLLIFDCLEMSDLHKFGQICKRWNALKLCAYKRIRVLTIGVFPAGPNESFDRLNVKSRLSIRHLTEQKQHKLLRLFPNVRVLTIKSTGVKAGIDIDAIANLLAAEQFATKLVSLYLNSLYGVFKAPLDAETLYHHPNYQQLVRSINSLSSLKNLTLHFAIPLNQIEHLSIVSQLESFTYRSILGGLSELAHLFKQKYKLPSGLSTLKKISISVFVLNDEHSFAQLNPEIALKVVHLDILPKLDKPMFEHFCTLFPSIMSVHLFLSERLAPQFTERFNCLAKFKKLKFLALSIMEPIEFDASKLGSFLSLEHLDLRLGENGRHNFLDNIKPAERFPNISTFTYSDYIARNIFIDREFLLHLSEKLKGCGKLRRIEYDGCYAQVGQDGIWSEFGEKDFYW